MVTDNHYRWDFIGLSTDVKPTPSTSSKVSDGSTFYCSDNSKLYVWYKTQWYERTAAGGGGTSYTAGDGIVIENDEISADLAQTTGESTTKLMSQKAITDALASAGGGVKELTADDYNYDDGNTGSFNTIGLWLLDDGIYKLPSTTQVKVKGGLTGSQVAVLNAEIANLNYHYLIKQNNHCWFLKDISAYNDQIKDYSPYYYCGLNKADGNYYRELDAQLLPYGKVSQTTGNSQNHVMSQNAVTSMVFADPATQEKIKIGNNTTLESNNSIAIGSGARVYGSSSFRSIVIGNNASSQKQDTVVLGASSSVDGTGDFGMAIGRSASCSKKGAIALGSYSNVSYAGEVNIGSTDPTYGYNSSNYRLLSGLYDAQNDHDAVTLGQLNTRLNNLTITTISQSDYNNLQTKDPNTLYLITGA